MADVADPGDSSPTTGTGTAGGTDSFPRQWARTQRLSLGEPRTVTVASDGSRVVFLRSPAGDDAQTALWVLDVVTGNERLVAEPAALLAAADAGAAPAETAEERARRERARESAGGITTYATDAEARVVAFALAGRLFVGGLISGTARELAVDGPVFDPRPDPTCRRVAYTSGRALRIAELDGSSRQVAGELDDPDVSWGQAEFVAAEEMHRSRGYWWSPDGTALAVARVDVGPVLRWHVGDLANPDREPVTLAYPAAGTDDALVTLHVVDVATGATTEVTWDHDALPYVADVHWSARHLTVTAMARDQRTLVVLDADPATGATTAVHTERDDAWVDLTPGTPARLADGRLLTAGSRDGRNALVVDGTTVSPDGWEVHRVGALDGNAVTFTANDLDEPSEVHVWRWTPEAGAQRLTHGPGVHGGTAGGDVTVIRSTSMELDGAVVNVLRGDQQVAQLARHAETPVLRPTVTFLRSGARRLPTALLLPHGVEPEPGTPPLPVLLDPYGGPGHGRVVQTRDAHTTSQWLADQGFAVLVVDGRGTPGLGSAWARAVHHDLADPVLEDQVDALHAVAAERPYLDLSRVGIRGWSFGGFLAALAVLRRPDVFHAAVAGAPVTDWRLYDTFYTERFLGHPDDDPDVYRHSSLLDDAAKLERPLLLVHGLADDNVVAAHTLRLSSHLLAAGRPHSVLPLSGVTHMTPQEVVAEHLLHLQVEFLHHHLGEARSSE